MERGTRSAYRRPTRFDEAQKVRKLLTDPLARIDGGEQPQAEMKPLKMHGGHSLGVHGVCPECGQNHGPLGNVPVAPWGSFDRPSENITKAIVNHSTKPLVSAERRCQIECFVRTLRLIQEAFHVKLKADTDSTGDMLIIDLKEPLPRGYEFSAYIEPDGQLEFAEWVLDDESGMGGNPQ